MNHAIRASSLRVIDEDGNQIGVMSKEEAISLAQSKDLDLVEISPNAKPPVAKVVDWGKYNYQKTKQLQKSKKNSKTFEVKQMRFSLKIGDHDLEIKLNKVKKFLDQGHKVKIVIFYRGRELAHKDIGFSRQSHRNARRIGSRRPNTSISRQATNICSKEQSKCQSKKLIAALKTVSKLPRQVKLKNATLLLIIF